MAPTDVEPAAFVLKGINWSDQAPESVVKAARVASQALEKRKEALTKSLAKKPGLSHLEKRTSKPRIFGEVHVALHEASSRLSRTVRWVNNVSKSVLEAKPVLFCTTT